MAAEPSCIFCQIVSGRSPCFKVCEDERTLAFMDLFPAVHGHALVIIKDHCENLFDAVSADLEAAAATTQRVAHAIRTALGPDGLSIYQANGPAAGQTVFHYHVHLLPRSHGSTLDLHGRRMGDREALTALAAELARALPA